MAYARYLAHYNLGHLGLTAPYPEAALAKRVAAPHAHHVCRNYWATFRDLWATARWCVLLTIAATIIIIAAMGASLATLAAAGKCGVLARAATSVTFNATFDITPYHYITIANTFPYGSLEVYAQSTAYNEHAVRK